MSHAQAGVPHTFSANRCETPRRKDLAELPLGGCRGGRVSPVERDTESCAFCAAGVGGTNEWAFQPGQG